MEHISRPIARVLALAASRMGKRGAAECLAEYQRTGNVAWLHAYERAAESEQITAALPNSNRR